MKGTSASVAVDRSIDDVFGFLADGMNNPLWIPDVRLVARVAGSSGPPGPGAAFFQKVKDASGRSVEEEFEITTWDPPRRLDLVTTLASTRVSGRFTLVAINTTTTHVEFALERLALGPRRTSNDLQRELQRRADAITNLPAAMKDLPPPPPA